MCVMASEATLAALCCTPGSMRLWAIQLRLREDEEEEEGEAAAQWTTATHRVAEGAEGREEKSGEERQGFNRVAMAT